MFIICPSCTTAYQVETSSLGARGRQVRCARCRTMWLATAESLVAATVEAETGPGDDALVAEPIRDDEDDGMSEWAAALADGPAPTPTPTPDSAAVAMADAPSLVPQQDDDRLANKARTIEPTGEDIETIAARRAPAEPSAGKRWMPKVVPPGLPVVIMTLVIVLAGLIQGRTAVVKALPQTGSLFGAIGLPVNLRGMTFDNFKTSQEFQDGATVLVVEGTIVNRTRSAVDVPRLRFGLRNRMGQEIYAWTALPQRSTLGPEEYLAVRTRLASPPVDGRDVVVRFFTRHDLASGLR
jgi:predicted Zn finger-like uncharacterized protein